MNNDKPKNASNDYMKGEKHDFSGDTTNTFQGYGDGYGDSNAEHTRPFFKNGPNSIGFYDHDTED